jgi:hypothetical protein
MGPTCKPCPIGLTSKARPEALPDDPKDSPVTMQHILKAASGDDQYWPQRIETAFTNAGFRVRRLEREQYHPTVWTVMLMRGCVELPKDNTAAAKQVRRILAKCGLKICAGEFSVVEQRGDRIKCAFLYGSPPPLVEVPPLPEADLGDAPD